MNVTLISMWLWNSQFHLCLWSTLFNKNCDHKQIEHQQMESLAMKSTFSWCPSVRAGSISACIRPLRTLWISHEGYGVWLLHQIRSSMVLLWIILPLFLDSAEITEKSMRHMLIISSKSSLCDWTHRLLSFQTTSKKSSSYTLCNISRTSIPDCELYDYLF